MSNAFASARKKASQLARLDKAEEALRGKIKQRYDARRAAIWSEASAEEQLLIRAAGEMLAPIHVEFGVDHGDSEALNKLRSCIDSCLPFPSEEHEERADYESAIEHAAARIKELESHTKKRAV